MDNSAGRVFAIITILVAIALLVNMVFALLLGDTAGKIIGLGCYIITMGWSLSAK